MDVAVAAGQKGDAQDSDASGGALLHDRFRQALVAFRFSQVKNMCRRLCAGMASLRNRATMEMKIVDVKQMRALHLLPDAAGSGIESAQPSFAAPLDCQRPRVRQSEVP